MNFDENGFYIPRDPKQDVRDLRAELLDLAGLRLLPPPRPLIHELNYDSLAWLSGQPGSFKSFLALDWACQVACIGEKVLYVVAEGAAGLAARVDAWESANRRAVNGPLRFLPRSVHIDRDWSGLVDLVGEARPALVVLDTQARMTSGLEENGPDMSRYVEAVDRVRRASGACVLSIHHSAKAGAWLRGHSSLMGAADTVISIIRPDELQPVVEVRNIKQKDAAQSRPYWMRPATQPNGVPVMIECERPDWWPKNA